MIARDGVRRLDADHCLGRGEFVFNNLNLFSAPRRKRRPTGLEAAMTLRSALTLGLALALAAAGPLRAGPSEPLAPVVVTDWKAVYGRIEARDRVPARTRIGGTLEELTVTEGDRVKAGRKIAVVVDDKLDFKRRSIEAQLKALDSQLSNARAELKRGEALRDRGVVTDQRLDGLRTAVEVLVNQIESARADLRVIEVQESEGVVLAPTDGVVLDVPVTVGAVVQPGEVAAMIGGGGLFLRLAVPERHALEMREGDAIQIEVSGGAVEGRLARVYPQIENGRVIADVEAPGLPARFVDARVLVRLPVGRRQALMIPQSALITRQGLDFVEVVDGDGTALRTVVPGRRHVMDGEAMVEILTGLEAGDRLASGDE